MTRKRRRRRRRRSYADSEEEEIAGQQQEEGTRTESEVTPDNRNEITPEGEEVSQEVQSTHDNKSEDCVVMEAEALEPEVEESLEPVVVERGNEVSGPIET